MSGNAPNDSHVVGEVLLWVIISAIIAATIWYGRWAQ